MVRRRAVRIVAGAVCALLLGAGAAARKAVLQKPVKVNGKPYRLTDGTPKMMCKAVVSEMHGEILKHNLRKDGEDEIFETAGMAICLGVVQNYTYDERKSGKWSLRAKTQQEKDDEEDGGLASMRIDAMMLLKESCFEFCEELQQEISEMTYRKVGEGWTPEKISEHFCTPDILNPKKPTKKKVSKEEAKRRAKKAASDADEFGGPGEGDMQGQYEKFLEKMNKDGSISELLRTDRDNPEMLLSEEDQQDVRTGREHLRCTACRLAVRHARAAAEADELAIRDEAKLSHLAEKSFIGHEEHESENMDYVPGNPPKWAEKYTVFKGKGGKWDMRRLADGEELGSEDGEGGDPYTLRVKRNTMIAQACRQSWDKAEESGDADLGELIVSHPKWPHKQLAERFCKPACAARKKGGGGPRDGEL